MTLVPEPGPDAPSVFISYSRRDCLAVADELKNGLELAGFRPLLNRDDISAAEDWKARLGALIQEADDNAFVISPSAMEYEVCEWEVDRTIELGKRLVPVLGVSVSDGAVPKRLAELHRIDFRDGQGVNRTLRELVATLRQDFGWKREHTRLTLAALRWDGRGEAADLLPCGGSCARRRLGRIGGRPMH